MITVNKKVGRKFETPLWARLNMAKNNSFVRDILTKYAI
jgi:hypothetical protein